MSKAARFIFVVVCIFAGTAQAYTTTTCEETWYAPTPGKEFSGSTESWKKVKEGKCQPHKMKLLELWDSGKSESFAIVDGKGYYVSLLDVPQGPGCGRFSGPGIDPQCLLPDALRHYETHKYRKYYQITTGPQLDLLDNGPAQTGKTASGCSRGRYATDGHSIFYATHAFNDEGGTFPYTPVRIEGADIATFKCFAPEGSEKNDNWALDREHVFLFGKAIDGMSSRFPVRMQGDPRGVTSFVINGDKVFEVDFDEVKFRPDIQPDLHLLSRNFMSDGKSVFDRDGKKIDGLHPAAMKIVMPVCPVPGYPQLHCVPYDSTIPTGMVIDGGIAVEDGVIAFPGENRLYMHKGLNARDIRYFFLKAEDFSEPDAFMLFDNRLFRLSALKNNGWDYEAETQERFRDGVRIYGVLRGAKCGAVYDDKGAISMDTLERLSPTSPYLRQSC